MKGPCLRVTGGLGVIFLFLIAGAACSASRGPEIGKPAPRLVVRDTEEKAVDLGRWSGEVLLVNLWATWCEPCKEEMPLFQELHQRYQASGLRVVLISLGDEPAEVVTYMAEKGYSFVSLVDTEGEVERVYRTNTLPSTFLIDAEGVLQRRWTGPVESQAVVEAALLPLLGISATAEAASSREAVSPTSTLSPTPSASPDPSPSPSATRLPTRSATPAPLPSATGTQRPTMTLTPTTTPSATVVPPSETPSATPIPAAVLYAPENNARYSGGVYAELRWGWEGELGEDMYFDVRFWAEGGEHHGVAWRKEPYYAVIGEPGVIYFWAIAVIRGEDGQMLAQLSPESEARSLSWARPEPTATDPPPFFGLAFQCGNCSRSAPAGELVIFDASLSNTGNVPDTFDVSIGAALPSGWQGMFCIGDECYTGGTHPVSLPAGGSQGIQIKIKSAASAPPGQSGRVSLLASSQGDPSKSGSVMATLTVE